jgi:TRAP-type uncharacterized transport system fused permease subunit
MGLPVTAAYVMLAVVAVPSLQDMGVSLLAAHMILFWLSQDSNVTPPVCLAAFTGAAIAGSAPMATGFAAWRIAKAIYIMPLLFAYTPLIDGSPPEKLVTAGFSLAGLFAFSAGTSGFLRHRLTRVQSAGLMAVAGSLFWPGTIWNCLGLVTLVCATAWSGRKARQAIRS